jgi:putative phosphoribosyl transferase
MRIVRSFEDRHHAGRKLAAALQRFKETDPVVLALPRGGVPVAFEVAKALDAPLDILLVRKIGAPGHEELALGAVVDGVHPQMVLNEEIVELAAPPAGYLERAKRTQLAEIERRRHLYRGDEAPIEVAGRTVIVIDDGIATGATVKAALQGVRRNGPRYVVLAVPLAPKESLRDLASACDEIVCLSSPSPFFAVGAHYEDFSQTTDEEVIALLSQAKPPVQQLLHE